MRKTYLLIAVILQLSSSACRNQTPPAGQGNPPQTAQQPPVVTVAAVQSLELSRQVKLPAELQAFQDVEIHARVTGFVESIVVDRGSAVKKGQVLARLRAPEIDTQRSESEARARSAEAQKADAAARINGIRAQRIEAEAKLAAEEATYKRLKAASATPGAVAGNDVDVALHKVEAARAQALSWKENETAAMAQATAAEENATALREVARSMRSIESYLVITAPFDGIVSERGAHQGSLASPAGPPLLRLQQTRRLRLIVPVPEAEAAGVKTGSRIDFTMPAFPGESFSGTVARISGSIDPKMRTMAVELDVDNSGGRLSPGMFGEVQWPIRRTRPSLFVPAAAIATTTEKSFVIRIRDGVAEWVDVKRGLSMSQQGIDLVEVFGPLAPGEIIAARGTDELRAGTRVNTGSAGLPPARIQSY